MASKIQGIVTQARATFSKKWTDPSFLQDFHRLKELMKLLTAEDFSMSHRETEGPWNYPPYVKNSPASCMEVFECPQFSVGIFLLKPKKKMPLHDHPGMYGAMKVLFGSMTVTAYSKQKSQSYSENRQKNAQTERVPILCKLSSCKLLDATSEPCVLQPELGNIHQIQANDACVAFIDILAPPYNPTEGRDCTYYEQIKESENWEDKSCVQLMPGPNPSWFSCVPLAYAGPKPS